MGLARSFVSRIILDYSEEFMHSALATNLPTYATAIVTTREAIDALLAETPARH